MGTQHDDQERGVLSRTVSLLLTSILICLCALTITKLAPPDAQADLLQTSITISICGNGLVDAGEVCDDGVNLGGYGPTATERKCSPDCKSFAPYCGDGILQVRFGEQCDEGTANSSTGLCSLTCTSIPAAPEAAPARVLGNIPAQPVPPGVIPAVTKTQVVLRGKAYPNSDVNILLDSKPLSIVRADTNADFLYTANSVTPGTATFSFWAKDAKGVESLTSSVVFDIVQSAVTSVNNIFLPPTLTLSDKQIAPGGLLTLSGQSVPSAQVLTQLDKAATSTLVSVANASGDWALQLDTKSITVGFHSVKNSFTLSSTTKSGFGKSSNFYVGNQLPSGEVSPDLNNDKKVNLVDFSIFLLSWNTHDARADFNRDGIVNLADFSILLFKWTG